MSGDLASRVLEEVLALDPRTTGNLTCTREASGRVRAFGRLGTTHESPDLLIRTALDNAGEDGGAALLMLTTDRLTVLACDEVGSAKAPTRAESRPHRWLDLIYQGLLPVSEVLGTEGYKRQNWESRGKVANCVAELGLIAPLILDGRRRVIDGDLRLSLAIEFEMTQVPVLMVDADDRQADFLRLVLNRSSEFQKWRYEEVDTFVDSMPQLQPLLEPLGFFGERLLPTSYFADSVENYRLDGSEQQAQYRQEQGLAEWAELQRKRVLEAEQLRQAGAHLRSHLAPKLFELPHPTENDFLPLHDPREAMGRFVSETKEAAHHITPASDARKAKR